MNQNGPKPVKTWQKKPTRKEFSPQVWHTIKIIFESGYYASLDALHHACTEMINPCPSVRQIRSQAFDEMWDRGRLDEIIEEKKARNATEILAEMGMDKAKRLEYLVKGIRASDSIIGLIEELKGKFDGKNLKISDRTEYMAAFKALEETNFKGLRVMIESLKFAAELTGEKAPIKIKPSGPSGPRDPQQKSVENLTDDELKIEFDRMKKAGIIDLLEIEGEEDAGLSK